MSFKGWMIAGAVAVAASAGSANAKPITYVGDYGPDLSLSITTDGVMGDITGHILSWNVESSIFSDGDLDSKNSDVFFMGDTGPSITASTAGLSYDFGGSDYNISFEGEAANNQNELLLIQSNGGFVGGNGFYIVDSPDDKSGTLITESGPTVIATPSVSAAPEPAAWSLMICGLALVGGALRLGWRGQAVFAG